MISTEELEDLAAAVLSIAERIAEETPISLHKSVRIPLVHAIEDALVSGYCREKLLEAISENLDLLSEEHMGVLLCLDSARIPIAGMVIEKGVSSLTDDKLACLAIKPNLIAEVADELAAKHYKPGAWFRDARKRQSGHQ
jgi:hypothetical protein